MKQKVSVLCLLAVWGALVLGCWLLPDGEISESERRPLAQRPQLSAETMLSGKFMSEFEEYTLDQFPLRDGFRTVKSLFHTYLLGQKDNNGIYLSQGYAAQQLYPMDLDSVEHFARMAQKLRDKYLEDCPVYLAVVPDKGQYLSQEAGNLALDMDKMTAVLEEKLPWAEYIDLSEVLTLADYYRTDTHWRQENLVPTAQVIANAMRASVSGEYEQKVLDRPFYGVYYGQAALPMEPEELRYLDSQVLSQCTVYDYETGRTLGVYDLEKGAQSRDPYDVFLSGSKSLLRIDNPNGKTDRELIVFRDSFGSSLVPLLVEDYQSVTLVDIRYIRIDMLERFLEFEGKEVLMVYSTLVLNDSFSIQ